MIYVHIYYTGKFNSVKHSSVYENLMEAKKQALVLGGEIKVCKVTRLIIPHK